MKTVWKTKDGQQIRIKDLQDSHLQNILKMLLRQAQHLRTHLPFPVFQGEMAQYYAEREYDRIMEASDEELCEQECEQWEALMAEAGRRNLVWWDDNGELQVGPEPAHGLRKEASV